MIGVFLLGLLSIVLGGMGYACYNAAGDGGYRNTLIRNHLQQYMYSFKMNEVLHDTIVSALTITINDQSDKIPTSHIVYNGRSGVMILRADSSYLPVMFGSVCDKTSLIRTITVDGVRFVLTEKQSQTITKLYGTLQVMYLVKHQGVL